MACGVALKRSLDFDVIRNSNSPVSCEDTPSSKCRKYNIAQRCGSVTSVTSTPTSVSSSIWQRYTPVTDATSTGTIEEKSPFTGTSATKTCAISSEQIVKHIYQEYRRMKKRKQLQAPPNPDSSRSNRMFAGSSASPSASGHSSLASNLPCITLDPRSTTSVVLPGKQSADTPLLSMKQVGLICERLLAEQEEKLRSEYEKTLLNKLSEQYDAFVKFSHDQLRQQLQERPASYVS